MENFITFHQLTVDCSKPKALIPAMGWAFASRTITASATGIITGRGSAVIEARAKDLGIEFVYQNCLEKVGPYEEMCQNAGVGHDEVCYVGDDLTDLPLLVRVGLGVCVANADRTVRKHSHFQTKNIGGNGAVREAIELILMGQGKWDAIVKSYLRGDRSINLHNPGKKKVSSKG